MATVLLITNEPVLAEGFRSFLAGSEHLLFTSGSVHIDELPHFIEATRADVVLWTWHERNGVELLSRISCALPGAKVVLVARDVSHEIAAHATQAGFSGVLDTTSSREGVLAALKGSGCGSNCPDAAATAGTKSVRLTRREAQLVHLLAQGKKNKEIATDLGISVGTVKVYLSALFRKAGTSSRFEMALLGLKNMVPAPNASQPQQRANFGPRTLVLPQTARVAERTGGPPPNAGRLAPYRSIWQLCGVARPAKVLGRAVAAG